MFGRPESNQDGTSRSVCINLHRQYTGKKKNLRHASKQLSENRISKQTGKQIQRINESEAGASR